MSTGGGERARPAEIDTDLPWAERSEREKRRLLEALTTIDAPIAERAEEMLAARGWASEGRS